MIGPNSIPTKREPSDACQSDIMAALMARPREADTIDIGPVLGLDKKTDVVFWVLTKDEQDQALAAAHAYVAKKCEQTPDAAKDADILADAKACFLVAKAMRMPADGGKMPVFVNGEVAVQRLTADRIGALTRLAVLVRSKHAPWPTDLSDDTVEALVTVCAAGAGGDMPERVLAGLSDVMLSHLAVLMAVKIESAREEAAALRAQIEALTAPPIADAG